MLKNKHAYALLLIFIAGFILITVKGLKTAQPGDENAYYYMGKMVWEGKVPYRDFFYAHPPLHVYLLALAYGIFGFNIIILKFIPLASTLVSAFFVFKIAQEKFGNPEAVISSLLFLSSYSILFNSVFSFGIEIAAMFLISGFYFLWNKDNYIASGILFGLAGITRLLALIPILVIFAAIFLSSKKNFIRLSSAFLIIFLLVNGAFIMLFGNDYIIPVYMYHLLKNPGSGENFREYYDILKLNWILFSSALLFLFAKDRKQANIFAAVSIVYLMFLVALKKLFGFYFIAVFPFLAIAAGYSLVNVFKRLNLRGKLRVFILILISSVFAWNLASDVMFLEKVGFTGFERGKDLAAFINSNSGKGTLLFGDDSAVPFLALLTNKKIALNFADTNNEVFISGVRDLSNVLGNLKGKDVLFIIRSKQGISYFSEVKSFLNTNCDLLSRFYDKTEGSYLVYRCR